MNSNMKERSNPLIESLQKKEKGIILYGLTPPKANNQEEKIQSISERRISRLKKVNVDGIILYDIQDEKSRNSDDRPFPFLPTIDPVLYKRKYLPELDLPTVFYQCVGKYTHAELSGKFKTLGNECTVLVGSSSKNETSKCSLREAYGLAAEYPDLYLGGVTIPERHVRKKDEHHRLISKQDKGVEYFISQFIFNIEKVKNILSDYYYECKNRHIEMKPILFTVTPCGSERTLSLLEWLGVNVPIWIKNEISHSNNPLNHSLDLCVNAISDISNFCLEKDIPFGCNIESVSIRKEEVLASFELVHRIEDLFKRMNLRLK